MLALSVVIRVGVPVSGGRVRCYCSSFVRVQLVLMSHGTGSSLGQSCQVLAADLTSPPPFLCCAFSCCCLGPLSARAPLWAPRCCVVSSVGAALCPLASRVCRVWPAIYRSLAACLPSSSARLPCLAPHCRAFALAPFAPSDCVPERRRRWTATRPAVRLDLAGKLANLASLRCPPAACFLPASLICLDSRSQCS